MLIHKDIRSNKFSSILQQIREKTNSRPIINITMLGNKQYLLFLLFNILCEAVGLTCLNYTTLAIVGLRFIVTLYAVNYLVDDIM